MHRTALINNLNSIKLTGETSEWIQRVALKEKVHISRLNQTTRWICQIKVQIHWKDFEKLKLSTGRNSLKYSSNCSWKDSPIIIASHQCDQVKLTIINYSMKMMRIILKSRDSSINISNISSYNILLINLKYQQINLKKIELVLAIITIMIQAINLQIIYLNQCLHGHSNSHNLNNCSSISWITIILHLMCRIKLPFI